MKRVEAGPEQCGNCNRWRTWMSVDGELLDVGPCIYDTEEEAKIALLQFAERVKKELGVPVERNTAMDN